MSTRTYDEVRAELSEARAKQDRIRAELEQIHQRAEGRALSEGEQQRWDRLQAGAKNARLEVERLEDELRAVIKAEVESGHFAVESGDGTVPLNGWRPAGGGGERDRARRVIDAAHRAKQLPDYAAERAERLVSTGPADSQSLAARWAIATGDEAYRSAFTKLLADPARGHLLWDAREADAYRRVAEVRAAMSLTPANGGYMVPLTLDPAIMLTSDGTTNPIRQLARVVQTATNTWQGVTSAGTTAEWKAEGAEAADKSPTVDDVQVPVHMGAVNVTFSYELGMDAPGLLEELRKVVMDAADQLQAAAFTTGSGSGQPQGLITGLAAASPSVTENGKGSEALDPGDPFILQNKLPARFSPRAVWMSHIATKNAFAQMETSNGALQFPELRQSPPMLLGKQWFENSNMDGAINASATEDNYLLVYGDFQAGFIIADRIGATLEILPAYGSTGLRPTGQRHAFLTFRTGSAVVVPNAFRLLNVATTA